MQAITVPSVLSPKPHIPPTTATCMLQSAGPRYIFVARPTGPRSSISLCYLKLRLISAHDNNNHSQHALQQVYLTGHPQSQHLFGRLSFQLSAASDWNKLQKSLNLETYSIFPSLTLNISYLNSPPNLPTSSPYCFYLLFCYFANQYLYLHVIICSFITPVLFAKL